MCRGAAFVGNWGVKCNIVWNGPYSDDIPAKYVLGLQYSAVDIAYITDCLDKPYVSEYSSVRLKTDALFSINLLQFCL